jgi:hypothetical protein
MPPIAAVLALAAAPVAAPVAELASAGGRLWVEDLAGDVRELALEGLAPEQLDGAVLLLVEGFERPAPPAGDARDQAELVLVGGDSVLGPIADGDGDHLEVRLLGGALLRVVIDRLESLTFPGRLDAGALAGLGPAPSGDRLYWIRPGGLDRVDGTFEAFEPGGVRFEGVIGQKTFPWGEIAALFVAPLEEELPESPPGERPVVIDLVDGGRLSGSLSALSAAGAVLDVPAAGALELPLGALAEIAADDGRSVFLSSLEPSEVVEGSPFGDDLGMRWPHRMDRSVTGGPLVAGGVRSGRGIGVHAPSRLVFRLDGSFAELRGAVAIDDTVLLLPHRGSVRFRVSVDGALRWESPLVRGGAAPVALPPVDLRGATELVLEVDQATRLHVADRADWLRMVLVREHPAQAR